MEEGATIKNYQDGEAIIRQGEPGDCMYVIQEGQVEIIKELEDNRVQLTIHSQGDFFGEMALFEPEVRPATVRALGRARIVAVNKKNFLRWIREDPSLAYRLVDRLSARLRELSFEIAQLRQGK